MARLEPDVSSMHFSWAQLCVSSKRYFSLHGIFWWIMFKVTINIIKGKLEQF